jgi:hypothetical protein
MGQILHTTCVRHAESHRVNEWYSAVQSDKIYYKQQGEIISQFITEVPIEHKGYEISFFNSNFVWWVC